MNDGISFFNNIYFIFQLGRTDGNWAPPSLSWLLKSAEDQRSLTWLTGDISNKETFILTFNFTIKTEHCGRINKTRNQKHLLFDYIK